MNYLWIAVSLLSLVALVHAVNLMLRTFWMIMHFFVNMSARMEATRGYKMVKA